MVSLIKCILGPKLYKINNLGALEGSLYEPNILEKCGDQVIRTISWIWSLGYYTSPIVITVLYRRGYFMYEGFHSISKFLIAIGLLCFASAWLRGFGRWTNVEYMAFFKVLQDFQNNVNPDTKREIMKYDFDFTSWPIEFKAKDFGKNQTRPTLAATVLPPTFVHRVATFPLSAIGYIFAHTIGCKIVYPGAVGLLQSAMGSVLLQGRTKLIQDGGIRTKLLTRDGNAIDTMLIDRRNRNEYSHGNKLVICSEGNAGFYEVGIMSTAIDAGYSVLGWNHPGFAGSTGTPYPDQEQNAIDSVIQFSVDKLGFKLEEIILFAWSIGGYTASWAALTYPDIHAVILDATFDNLEPLAVAKMPASWAPLIRITIRNHMNLNVSDHLNQYPGRVRFIRRTNDEMITTDNPPTLRSNRGNNLVFQFLKARFPKLVDNDANEELLMDWLTHDRTYQGDLWRKYGVQEDFCVSNLRDYFKQNPRTYPSDFGEDLDTDQKAQLILFLANKHLVDFNSTHCTQLPKQMFVIPWDPLD